METMFIFLLNLIYLVKSVPFTWTSDPNLMQVGIYGTFIADNSQ